jgi:hypothetical protein
MQRNKQWIAPIVVSLVILVSPQGEASAEVPMTKEVKAIVDFQCHGAKTLKKAEANHAYMARSYTDRHPVMECLNKKIEELKAAGK